MKTRKILICITLIIAFVSLPFNSCFAVEPVLDSIEDNNINNAIKYLHSIQNEDGGFPSREGRDSSISLTCWVIMALNAAGEDIESSYWKPKNYGPVDYLLNSDNTIEETNEYARLLLTFSAINHDTIYKGKDLAKSIISFQQDNGQFSQLDKGEKEMINVHMWSILALASAGYEIPNKEKAKEFLISSQNEDGGFGWLAGGESDSDDTAIAIQALIILGENPKDSKVIKKALVFIKSHQQEDGGFSSSKLMGNDSNCASDAWVLQGLIAAKENYLDPEWSENGNNVRGHLLSLQKNDGSINWKSEVSSSTVTMTAYAIIALCQKPFPINIDYNSIIVNKDIFTDLEDNYWAYDEIIELSNKDIIHGYPDGTFKPEALVTRAEFTNLIVNGFNIQNYDCNKDLIFTDISKEFWAYKSILIAFESGIVNGRSSKIFDPYGNITGAELATMLVNCLPSEKKRNIEQGEYWYSENVKLANDYKLLYPNFIPTAYATRAQCAYSIVKIMELAN